MAQQMHDYKQYKVYVDENGSFFAADKDNEQVAVAKTLDDLKQALDKLSKAKMGIPVFVKEYEDWIDGKITSVRDEHGYGYSHGKKFRVTHKYSRGTTGWSDVRAEGIIKHTADNEARVLEINKLVADKRVLEKRIESLEKSLERYTEEELLGG